MIEGMLPGVGGQLVMFMSSQEVERTGSRERKTGSRSGLQGLVDGSAGKGVCPQA